MSLLQSLSWFVLAVLVHTLTGCTPAQEEGQDGAPVCACEAPQAQVLAAYVANATEVIHGRDELRAMCDPGFLATGGGCMGRREDGSMVAFQGAAALDDTMSPTGWHCEAEPPELGRPFRVTASAICLHVQD
jgi:hypothetical protein